jgi:hypothetical protein
MRLTGKRTNNGRYLFPRGWAGPTEVREARRGVRALFHAREQGIGPPMKLSICLMHGLYYFEPSEGAHCMPAACSNTARLRNSAGWPAH